MKQIINKALVRCILVFVVVAACNKKLDQTNQNLPTVQSYFKTAAELQAGVNAIYSTMRSPNLVGREWFFLHDTRSDEFAAGGSQLEAPRFELLTQPTPATSNSVMTSVWTSAYIMISRANGVLSKASEVTDNVALRDQSIGEAKFLRAWAYFELASQWGQVPLYIAPVVGPTEFKDKSPEADVYALIIADLTDAVAKLPATYDATNRGRATKGAANTLLGRVQLQKNDYAAAKAALLQVVNANLYNLKPDYLDNFVEETEFNSESIFEVVFFDRGDNNFNWGNGATGDGASVPQSTVRNQEYSPIAWRNLIPSNKYLAEFEAADPRYKKSIYETGDLYNNAANKLTDGDQAGNSSVVAGVTKKISWRKYMLIYKSNSGFIPGGINQRLMRYADVLLMLAECEAEAGTVPAALGYINQVRARQGVNMTPVTVNAKNDVLKAIMHERSVELGAEEVKNVDILRWRKKGYYPSIAPDPKPGQVDMLPIPQSERDANPALK